MMHGRGKADSAIVAKKLANKAGQPTAERAEPKAGPTRSKVRKILDITRLCCSPLASH
jgi:hypothetical protein